MSEGVNWGSGIGVGGGTEWACVGGPRTGGNGIWLFHEMGPRGCVDGDCANLKDGTNEAP